jgi:transcription initiation factor TFIIIB Brf1 subunit/transcription initiation factor TFIIB
VPRNETNKKKQCLKKKRNEMEETEKIQKRNKKSSAKKRNEVEIGTKQDRLSITYLSSLI